MLEVACLSIGFLHPRVFITARNHERETEWHCEPDQLSDARTETRQ